jgi:hypothetical protein
MRDRDRADRPDPVGGCGGGAVGDRRTPVVADEHGLLGADRIEQAQDVRGGVVSPVARPGTIVSG